MFYFHLKQYTVLSPSDSLILYIGNCYPQGMIVNAEISRGGVTIPNKVQIRLGNMVILL